MSEPEPSDAELAERAARGDEEARSLLVRRHTPALRRLVRRFVREADAEDVAQRALVKALARLSELRDATSFRSWLYTIAQNLAKNHVRDHDRRETREVLESDLVTNALGTTKLVAREAKARVMAEIERLPDKQRRAIELRLFEGLSFKEIGERIDSSEDAAKANYHHGVKRLRAVVESD